MTISDLRPSDPAEDFSGDPERYFDALLRGQVFLGHLNVAEPADLVSEWLRSAYADDPAAIDEICATWLERHWMRLDDAPGSPLTIVWHRYFQVLADIEGLPRTTAALFELLPQTRVFLQPLSGSPSRDPLGSYYRALSVRQTDERLRTLWWNLVSLRDGVPHYHFRVGVLGLRRMPTGEALGQGGFRLDVASALERGASSLAREVAAGRLSEAIASRTWKRVAVVTVAAYPFPRQWRAFWASAIHDSGPPVSGWMAAVAGISPSAPRPAGRPAARTRTADPAWTSRAQDIARRLPSSGAAMAEARVLIKEQSDFAAATGNTDNIAKTLSNFAKQVLETDTAQAIEWAQQARRWNPDRTYPWCALVQAYLILGDLDRALEVGWLTYERFPYDKVARNVFADALKKAEDLPAAAAIYRETLQQFPDEEISMGGYADVLIRSGDLDAAAEILRRGRQLYPSNAFFFSLNAELLRRRRDLPGAVAAYREAADRFPRNPVIWMGLSSVLHQTGEHGEAEKAARIVAWLRPPVAPRPEVRPEPSADPAGTVAPAAGTDGTSAGAVGDAAGSDGPPAGPAGAPEAGGPGTADAGTAAPGTAAAGNAAAGTAETGSAETGTAASGTATPRTGTPDSAAPGTVTSEPAAPGTAAPETGTPAMGTATAATSAPAPPDAATSGRTAADSTTPGSTTPGAASADSTTADSTTAATDPAAPEAAGTGAAADATDAPDAEPPQADADIWDDGDDEATRQAVAVSSSSKVLRLRALQLTAAGGTATGAETVEALLARAETEVSAALEERGTDVRLLFEYAAVLVAARRLDDAAEFLRRTLTVLPNAGPLYLAAERVQRMLAERDAVTYSEEALAGILEPLDALTRGRADLQLLHQLEEFRSFTAMRDGQVLADRTAGSWRGLRTTLTEEGDKTDARRRWLTSQLGRVLGPPDQLPEQWTTAAASVVEAADQVDLVEEELVRSVMPAPA